MAQLSELLFQPTFEKKASGDRAPEQRDNAAAIKTYRYLRLAMIMVVVAIAAAVFIQWHNAGSWQGSISAYYYSPARAVFVSGLLVIAVSLIVIKGSTLGEDLLLTGAGMLAPLVAFVPTTQKSACGPHAALVCSHGLPPAIVDDAQNNLGALLVAGFVALILGIVILAIEQRGDDRLAARDVKARMLALVVTGVFLLVGAWLLANEDILDLHGWAAVFMFVFLGLASGVDGGWLFWINRGDDDDPTSVHWRLFAWLYVAVAVAMILAGLIIKYLWPGPWEHRTFVLEFTEIGLFGAMWMVQSVERWGKILQAKPE